MKSTLKIYGAKAVKPELKGVIRDIRVTWLLEELQVPYELIQLDPAKGENKTPEYLKINPSGKVPTLVDGDFAIFESAAICEYLAEKNKKFIPEHGTPNYFLCKQWNYFAVTNVEPQCARVFSTYYFLEQNETTMQIRKLALDILPRFLTMLEQHLENRDYLLGAEFSVADILLVTSLTYGKPGNVWQNFPNVTRYMDRNMARPAFKLAFSKNG